MPFPINAVFSRHLEAMEVRICMPTPLEPSVKVTVINGYNKYKLEGIAVEPLNEAIDFSDRLFYNRSYFFTDNQEECLERLSHNQSDYSTFLSLYTGDISAGISVLVPFLPTKTSMLSAYDLSKLKSKDDSSALSNFGHFDLSVYIHLFLLLTLFLVCTGFALFVTLFRRKIVREMFFSRRGYKNVRFCPQTLTNLEQRPSMTKAIQSTVKKCCRIIQQSSIHLKHIFFLFALLCLFMMAFFYGAYSTNRIIMDQRRVIKTYEELIEDHAALVHFYDQLSEVSSRFQHSQAHTLRGKVWMKLSNEPGGREKNIVKRVDRDFTSQMKALFAKMEEAHSVIIATSFSNRALSWLICGCSPENELWTSTDHSDPSETERLEGWSVNYNSRLTDFMRISFRRLIESNLLELLTETGLIIGFQFSWQLAGTSTEHKFLQQRVCLGGGFEEKGTAAAKDMETHYYVTTFIFCAVIYVLALVVLLIELIVSWWCLNQDTFHGSAKIPNHRRREPRQRPFRPMY